MMMYHEDRDHYRKQLLKLQQCFKKKVVLRRLRFLREEAVKTKLFDFDLVHLKFVLNFKVYKNVYIGEYVAIVQTLKTNNPVDNWMKSIVLDQKMVEDLQQMRAENKKNFEVSLFVRANYSSSPG